MNCITCKISVNEKPLFRTSPLGEIPTNWKCEKCMTQKELRTIDSNVKAITVLLSNKTK